jgi:hypothetical protein
MSLIEAGKDFVLDFQQKMQQKIKLPGHIQEEGTDKNLISPLNIKNLTTFFVPGF